MKLKQRIGTMAVITDEGQGKTELVNVDAIAIISIVINGLTGIAQFAMAFGGEDSNGRFHLDLKRANEVAHITITREQNPQMFDALFCDASGNPKMDFSKNFFDMLCDDFLVKSAHKMIWGAKYPDMEVSRGGKVIFDSKKQEK
jgi:hypothetical protein